MANYLYPGCKVVAGSEAALRWLEARGAGHGVRRAARVAAAGPLHCRAVRRAAPPLREALRMMEVHPHTILHSQVLVKLLPRHGFPGQTFVCTINVFLTVGCVKDVSTFAFWLLFLSMNSWDLLVICIVSVISRYFCIL